MNRIQNILLLILAAAMVFLCIGCGEPEPETVSTSKAPPATETTEPETTEPPTTEAAPEPETWIYEEENLRVSVGEWTDTWMGPQLPFTIENRSEQDILITAQYVSVNGWMMPLSVLRAEVNAGANATASLTFPTTQLQQCGIEQISRLSFYLQIADGETWEEIARSELITLDIAPKEQQSPAPTGQIVFEQEGIKILSISNKKDLIADGAPLLYIENNRPQPVQVKATNITINGTAGEPTTYRGQLRGETRLQAILPLPEHSTAGPENPAAIETITFDLIITDLSNPEAIPAASHITLTFEK